MLITIVLSNSETGASKILSSRRVEFQTPDRPEGRPRSDLISGEELIRGENYILYVSTHKVSKDVPNDTIVRLVLADYWRFWPFTPENHNCY